MATIAEAQRIAQQSRQAIAEQKRIIAETRQRVEQARARQLTRAELQRRTQADIVRRKQQLKQFEQLKQSQLSRIDPFSQQIILAERELTTFEREISAAQKSQAQASAIQRDIAAAQKIVERGLPSIGETPSVLRFVKKLQAGQEAEIQKFSTELAKAGLAPVFVKGELTGFSDEINKINIQLKDIGAIGEERIGRLIEAGIVEPILAPLTVEITPSETEQLKRFIRESTPDFKITNTQVENIIEGAIGLGFGTERFLRAKLSGDVANLRDARGQRIFTGKQAVKIVDIVAEVSEGRLLGLATGKAFTFVKGGVGTILTKIPSKLRDNPAWQKAISLVGFAGGTVLTVSAVSHIAKTFREEGTDAAVIETLGLVSFGAGFTKTGLKTNVQAQKEFNRIADLFKKVKLKGIKGKRGAARVSVVKTKVKKKLKKKVKDKKKVKEFTQEEIDELVAELERRLINAKTPREQMKILAEIFSKLKTPEQKANFRKLVQLLFDREILIIDVIITGKKPTVRVKKPVKIKEEVIPAVKKPKKKKKVKVEEVAPVVSGIFAGKQIFFDTKQIAPSQIMFEPVVTPSALPRQIQTAKLRFNVLVTQGVSPKVLQAQAFKLLTLQKQQSKLKQVSQLKFKTTFLLSQSQRARQKQKERQALKSLALLKTKQALKQKFVVKQVFKIKAPTKKVFKIGLPPPPFIPKLPKGVKSTPLVKTLRMKGKQGFNILVGQKKGKQMIVGKNLPAFKALKKGRRFVDKNIQASFKLVPTGKKAKTTDIVPFNIGRKFRSSKKDPLFIVEKRPFRLDTKSEVFQIKQARRKSTKRRKTTKKRRKR